MVMEEDFGIGKMKVTLDSRKGAKPAVLKTSVQLMLPHARDTLFR